MSSVDFPLCLSWKNIVKIQFNNKCQTQHDIFLHHFVYSLFFNAYGFPINVPYFIWKVGLMGFFLSASRVRAFMVLIDISVTIMSLSLAFKGNQNLLADVQHVRTNLCYNPVSPHFLVCFLATKDAEWNTQFGPLLITQMEPESLPMRKTGNLLTKIWTKHLVM